MQQQYAYKPSWTKISLLALGLVALVAGGYFLARKIWPSTPPKVYEVAIQVRDQVNADHKEDLKNSFKIGDAVVVLPEGHSWSDTEKVSYLIIKMKLTEDQTQKLVAPDQKEIKQETRNTEQKTRSEEDDRGPQMETIRMRQYRVKIEKLDKNFNPNILIEKQPFQDKVYDWGLVEKKKSVKS